MTRLALIATAVLALAGGVSAEVYHAMDACPGIILCDQLDEAFNRSGVYVTDRLHELYCHMETGRWTEVFRRGEDATGTVLAEAEHTQFAAGSTPEPMISGIGDPAAGEFYVGNGNLTEMLAALPAPGVASLKVTLLGQDDVRYFSVFDGFRVHGDPATLDLSTLRYRIGTAGDGDLAALNGAVYDGTCAPTAWFTLPPPGSGTCDTTVDEGPALTMPLVAGNQRNGRTPWPTLPVELKAVSMQLHTQQADTCQGLETHYAFDGDVLTTIEDTLPSTVDADQSFTITCKNTSWILPTDLNTVGGGAIPNAATFTCAADPTNAGTYLMDDNPVIAGKPCMAPCPDGYTLYIPDTASSGIASVLDRVTCLSPASIEPARSLVEAAALCGERGEQLLDFVPQLSYLPADLDTTQPLWLSLRQQTSTLGTMVNTREELSGTVNIQATAKCAQVTYAASPPALQQTDCHWDWTGTTPAPAKNYVCMTAVGCGPGAVFHRGFCYSYVAKEALATDHWAVCEARGATPADYTAEFVAEALPQLNVPSTATPAVGIYRRYDKFWRPDGSVVPVSEFDGGTYGTDPTLQCAATLPADPTKLTPVLCTDFTSVICQTPSYASVSLRTQMCSVRYDQLLNASSTGPAPTLVRTASTSIPTLALSDVVTLTCPDGYNVHNLTAFHSVSLTCQGFQDGWMYPADMDAALHGLPIECVFACAITEESKPRNSELVTVGDDTVFRCAGPMQTADGSTEQIATCDHATAQLTAGLLPCDQCINPPLVPGTNSTVTSNWDGTTRLEGTVVSYTCLAGLETPDGGTVQNLTCTADGWEGEVVPCSFCTALNETQLLPAVSTLSGPQPLGALANITCPAGLQSLDGSIATSTSCLPEGWDWCLPDFNCSFCSGNPPNVSAMATITSDWDGAMRELGTTVLYTCATGLQTADGSTLQHTNCTETGWIGDPAPCNVCSNPPNGSHPTISTTEETGDGTLGSSLRFVCNAGLSAADGLTSITSVCTEAGWSNCSQDIKCEFCAPLPQLPDGTMDWGAYAGERALGTEVTLTCNTGLAIPGSLAKTQTVVCGLAGWNHTAVQSCTVCDQNPPAPASSMSLAWTLGDAQAVYQCPNNTMLPWGEVRYLMQCSPEGWSDCVPECTACVYPPAAGVGAHLVSMNVSRGGISRYECNGNLTSSGPASLELTCEETGWTQADMIVCDMCNGVPTDAGPSQNRTGNNTGLIGTVLNYLCLDNMTTADGLMEQTMECSTQGWTLPPEPCDHCPLPPAPDGVTQTYDLFSNLTGNITAVPVGTNVTYTCSNITAILSTNTSSQMLSCGADGWSGLPEACVSCLEEIPAAGNGTEARNVTWDGGRHEGAVVLYTCTNGAQQEVHCVDRQWTPAELGPCGAATPSSLYRRRTGDDGDRALQPSLGPMDTRGTDRGYSRQQRHTASTGRSGPHTHCYSPGHITQAGQRTALGRVPRNDRYGTAVSELMCNDA